MMLKECFSRMGGDYEEVLGRLLKPERIEKYVLKFLEDATFEQLCVAKTKGNHEEVFRMIHTLKGISQNLGFGSLYLASDEMTEAVRGGIPLTDERLFQAVERAYHQTIETIKMYQSENE